MSRLHRDIAALADGSREAPGLRERIAADPELQAVLEEQKRAVALAQAARPPAPPRLRASLARPPQAAARPRPARRPVAGLVAAVAGVLALTVVAVLPGGAAPSVTSVAALALRGPAGPAPGVDARHPDTLGVQLAGVRYPSWQEAFGRRPTGARTDTIDGRATMTVYYARRAQPTVGYTIVSGPPLPEPGGATITASGGTRYLGLTAGARTVVTWRRAGHTCVISATGVRLPTLLRLAEWRYDATPA
jgi:hypothetical protein